MMISGKNCKMQKVCSPEFIIRNANVRNTIGIIPEGNASKVESFLFKILRQVAEGFPIHDPAGRGLSQGCEIHFVLFLVRGDRGLSLVQLGLGLV